MLHELELLFTAVPEETATKKDYFDAIVQNNCLGKRSMVNRHLTFRHMATLYSLDGNSPLFQALRYLWHRDATAHPLLAALCSYARDSLFRLTFPFLLSLHEEQAYSRSELEHFIEEQQPGRFSKISLESLAQHLASSWTQAGYLQGCINKHRSRATASPGSVAYALFLGYLSGARGSLLLHSQYARMLDCPAEQVLIMAKQASSMGWIVCNHIDNVLEVRFPNFLTTKAQEMLREQNQTTAAKL